jgi:hypothetical protein
MSKMHGCYNAIGLWFIEGVAGITVNASDTTFPIHIRAGIESGDLTWAKGARSALYGKAESSWSVDDAHGEYAQTPSALIDNRPRPIHTY